jgi:hypothetical protein
MRASRTITLFAPPPFPTRSGSTAIVVSVLIHIVGYGWMFVGFWNTPRITARPLNQRFTVRILNAPRPEPVLEQPAPVHLARSIPSPVAPRAGAGGTPAPMPAVATQLANLVPKQQILIQPDAPPDIVLQHPTPVPLVLRWSAPAEPVKTITAAPLQKAIIAKLLPSIEPPNKELMPSNLKMSSTNFSTALAALPPSTTSPVVVRAQAATPHIPETTSKRVTDPAPARVISLSDLRSPEGPTPIPLANSLARPAAVTSLGNGATVSNADAGHGSSTSKQPGNGPGQGPGLVPGPGSSQTKSGTGTAAVAQNGGGSGPAQPTGNGLAQQSGTGSDQLNEASITRIHLAKDGQFGVVVVGSSIAEQYPETVGLWGGRTVYTVYLHLGHGKAWLLQYSLPPTAQTVASNIRPDAPWPFDLVQPHLDSADFTTDALMVHGFVNLAGRFEKLAVVFPTQFAQTKFVLSALQQWQFRPARQNGQLAAVEVLLIIPDQGE